MAINRNSIFISSIFLSIAYLFSVMTIFYAPLSLTASARYSVIIFGMIFGYLLLGEVPSYNMIIGAIIISLSGLFVIKRQKDLENARKADEKKKKELAWIIKIPQLLLGMEIKMMLFQLKSQRLHMKNS